MMTLNTTSMTPLTMLVPTFAAVPAALSISFMPWESMVPISLNTFVQSIPSSCSLSEKPKGSSRRSIQAISSVT